MAPEPERSESAAAHAAPRPARAVRLPRHGPPEVFEDVDAGPLQAAPGDVLVATRAAGINFADVLQRLGLYANAPKPPYVPGFEVAGDVLAVGQEVTEISVGDRVVVMTPGGGYAEQVLSPHERVWRIPESISYEQAAAIPVNFLTAWICLFTMGNLRADETVLIHGGAGGVGTAAIQLAAQRGSRVIATAGSERKLSWLRDRGVDLAVDYRQGNWDQLIREQLGKRPIDLVLDPVGGDTQRRSYQLLAPLGRLISYGLAGAVAGPQRNLWRAFRAWRSTPRYHPVQMIGRNTGVFGFHLALLRGREQRIAEALRAVFERITQGDVQPVIDSTFPLNAAGVAAAHRYLHERRNIGKLLLVPTSGD